MLYSVCVISMLSSTIGDWADGCQLRGWTRKTQSATEPTHLSCLYR